MTYLETITYLTGRYLQVSQFALKNAYRLVTLTEGAKKETPYFSEDETYEEALESQAIDLFKKNKSLSGEEQIAYFETREGISEKDRKNLYKVLRKRDYLVGYYFLDNSADFGKEEVAIFESKITELKELVSLAEKTSLSLSKACEKLIATL